MVIRYNYVAYCPNYILVEYTGGVSQYASKLMHFSLERFSHLFSKKQEQQRFFSQFLALTSEKQQLTLVVEILNAFAENKPDEDVKALASKLSPVNTKETMSYCKQVHDNIAKTFAFAEQQHEEPSTNSVTRMQHAQSI